MYYFWWYVYSPNFSLNSSSVQIGIPSSLAFSYLLPGFAPTITALVFLDTELEALPPSCSIFSSASSLVNNCREPVKTNVLPLNSEFSSNSWPKYLVLRPISFSSSTILLWWLQRSRRQRPDEWYMAHRICASGPYGPHRLSCKPFLS